MRSNTSGLEEITVSNGQSRVFDNYFEEEVNFDWRIKRWENVAKDAEMSVKVLLSPTTNYTSKWQLGFDRKDQDTNLYVKLIDSIPNCAIKSKITADLVRYGEKNAQFSVETNFMVGVQVPIYSRLKHPWSKWASRDNGYVNQSGEIVFQVKMVIVYEFIHAPQSLQGQAATASNVDKWTTLLRSKEFQDFTLVSRDGKEFRVNKHLIEASCPRFYALHIQKEVRGMIATVKDVKGEALGILIRYWYTGVLAEIWYHPGVLYELTSAAATYGMSELLEFLNNTLGNDKFGGCDIRLLQLVNALDLKRAEARITHTLVNKTGSVKTSDELLALFACSCSP